MLGGRALRANVRVHVDSATGRRTIDIHASILGHPLDVEPQFGEGHLLNAFKLDVDARADQGTRNLERQNVLHRQEDSIVSVDDLVVALGCPIGLDDNVTTCDEMVGDDPPRTLKVKDGCDGARSVHVHVKVVRE